MRMQSVLLSAIVAGGLGAAWTSSESTFVMVGCGLLWFLVAFAVLMWARSSKSAGRSIAPPRHEVGDPWTDEQGVHHFPGDVFDIANSPHPGKHSRP